MVRAADICRRNVHSELPLPEARKNILTGQIVEFVELKNLLFKVCCVPPVRRPYMRRDHQNKLCSNK